MDKFFVVMKFLLAILFSDELRHTAKDDLSQHEGSVIDFEEDLDVSRDLL